MKLIKIIFASYYLFATYSILPMVESEIDKLKHEMKLVVDRISSLELIKNAQNLKATPISYRSTMKSAARTTKIAGILFGVYVYTDQIVTGPQDFTKLPEISTQDIKNRWQDMKTTLENTRKSLELHAKTETAPHARASDAVKLQGGSDNDRRD